jgi:hypothetical protein
LEDSISPDSRLIWAAMVVVDQWRWWGAVAVVMVFVAGSRST